MTSNMNYDHPYKLMSFVDQSSIPHFDYQAEGFQSGTCAPNVDGVCISSGYKVGGLRGYRLPSMGYPQMPTSGSGSASETDNSMAQCATFPLWYGHGRPYELLGIKLATSHSPFNVGQR